jgi:hypothetical protein
MIIPDKLNNKMLLYEKLISGIPHTVICYPELTSALDKAQVFSIDNVAEYFFMSPQLVWDVAHDYPNLAPPFENMYFEYKVPPKMRVKDDFFYKSSHDIRIGILCNYQVVENLPYKWGCTMTIIIGIGENIEYIAYSNIFSQFGIHENGTFAPVLSDKIGGRYVSYYNKMTQKEVQANLLLFDPALLAISFMHCKNVVTITQECAAHIGKRNHRHPRITFKTLEIEPMKKILKTEGQSETLGLKHALHICRGHFKDFRERGLFGKFHGIYWWESQVRGKLEDGIVFKDYSINVNEKKSGVNGC